jgi:hypothetical protein
MAQCSVCLQQLPDDLSQEGLENHKAYCRAREIDEFKHRQEVAEPLNQFKPLNFDDVAKTLGSTVKNDRANKLILFSAMLLTYTEEEQVNVLMAAESAAGKSYLPLELAQYFPQEDVHRYGGASPTAFFHEVSGGELATWDEEKKLCRVNLANKILVFLDQPHDMLLQKLRAFLSHDQREITYKIADRSQKSGLRTRTIVLVGYPTWIFCTANFSLDQQERTRNIQLSPETGDEKVKEGMRLLLERKSNRDRFLEKLREDPDRAALRQRIASLKDASIRDVVIPESLRLEIDHLWTEQHPIVKPRHVRDLGRFISLVKAHALLNFALRPRESDNRIVAVDEDLQETLAVYKDIAAANELGIAPQIYQMFLQVVATFKEGASKKQLLAEYHAVFHRPLPPKQLEKEIIPTLEAAGLVTEEPDPDDKRVIKYYPHPPGYLSRNIPSGVGGPAYDLLVKALRKRGASTWQYCLEMAETITGDPSQGEKLLGQLTADVVLAEAPDGRWRIVKALEGS